ncbi:sensor domain-containing diguanylate cyclase [Marinimicrobium sp. ABcell2]|uniref:sensor domain-containing diguanylate cyclase n=1 Tax=Marinimicrobium sp. ABcell2 TaxID=3069751 RepID=UPI0027B24605|nr:sensor domain-containing diguanylate cyclase [Marinimicrobium sp. ABcell2]MDQ2075887.1 sensor domain-containing diguanylate cyclase [Marinimicrobium sp. ABcell2]
MQENAINMTPFEDFDSASRAVLRQLRERLGFDLWMMTRTEGHDWIVLQAEDCSYGVADGAVFQWADSYCSRMVRGEGPRIAPNALEVSAYAKAPINQQVKVGAYVGVPVYRDDGSLFGTLCGIDPNPQLESIENELPLVELFARLLGTILSHELNAIEHERVAERSQREAMTDVMTGLLNRRGWDEAVATEEARARRYGSPVGVVILDLDQLKEINDLEGHAKGDELLCRAAQVLNHTARKSDIVARLGGDEFGILAVESGATELDGLSERLRASLDESGVLASIGKATRDPTRGILDAIADADRRMYEEKSVRQAARCSPT